MSTPPPFPGYWLLAIGYWLLAIGYWLLAIGYWLLAIGYWLLAIGYWLAGSYATLPIATSGGSREVHQPIANSQ
jgi:hypothetical protein